MLKENKIVNVLISCSKIIEKKEKAQSFLGRVFSFSEKKTTDLFDKKLTLLAEKIQYFSDISTEACFINNLLDIDLFLENLQAKGNIKEVLFFPLFPQFSYELTGKLAYFFYKKMAFCFSQKCFWIKSYSHHPEFIRSWQKNIKKKLNSCLWKEEETIFLFFAEDLNKRKKEDLFQYECLLTKRKILKKFPYVVGNLLDLETILSFMESFTSKRKNLLFIPISSLFESQLPLLEINAIFLSLQKKGFSCQLCPPLNLNTEWIHGICNILEEGDVTNSLMLIPPKEPSAK